MGILHAATLSGFKHLAGSFSKGAEASTATALGREASLMGKAALFCATPLLVPLNIAAHGAAYTVKSYRGLWRRAPGLAALGTAAVVVPTALLTMKWRGEKNDSHDQMREVDQMQGQSGQVLGMLQATEPAMPAPPAPRQEYASLQLASPQIMAAESAMPEGKVVGSAAAQGI